MRSLQLAFLVVGLFCSAMAAMTGGITSASTADNSGAEQAATQALILLNTQSSLRAPLGDSAANLELVDLKSVKTQVCTSAAGRGPFFPIPGQRVALCSAAMLRELAISACCGF